MLTLWDLDADKGVDEITDMLKDLKKKKKKKSKDEDEGAAADGEFDPSALKKKKKSKKPKGETVDDFEAKLKAAGEGAEDAAAPEAEPVQEGDMWKGTGIWNHDNTTPINYNLLLNRFFTLLHSQHPDLATGSKSYKIPPPQCLREGNKKVRTRFCNCVEAC